MADKIHGFMPATFDPPNDRQRLFLRYVTGVLIDLAVFGLFADYWSAVQVSSFTVMLLAAILLITTTIRLSAISRRRETGIMRLVGASNLFIQLPFMLEGAIAATIGAALAVGALWAGLKYLVADWLGSSIQWIPYVNESDLTRIAPVLIVIGIMLATISSVVTLNRFTRV